MTALTRARIAELLYEDLGVNKSEGKEIVASFFEEIAACLEKNGQVKLSGFGNFNLRNKSARPGRNPKTGKECMIAPRRVVTFHSGQKLRGRVAGHVGPEAKS